MLISVQPVVLATFLLMSNGSPGPGPRVAQEPAAQAPPPAQEQPAALAPSLDRIREEVARTPALTLATKPPRPTFRTTTEGRALMAPFEEYLRQELELTPLQRQSQDWASRCCGIDLGRLFKGVEQALERRKTRQVREQIRRELAELETRRTDR